MKWLFTCTALLATALAVFMVPSRFEGAVLLTITPNHGLSKLDLVGLVPLSVGMVLLLRGLWRRRGNLAAAFASRPTVAAGAPFVAVLGLGLMLISVVARVFWLWAVGVALLTGDLVAVAAVAARGDPH
jgi:hypothetical protein